MAVLLANIALAIPFLVAFIGVPLWMTFKRPETGPDHLAARRYLRARADQTASAAAVATQAKAA